MSQSRSLKLPQFARLARRPPASAWAMRDKATSTFPCCVSMTSRFVLVTDRLRFLLVPNR